MGDPLAGHHRGPAPDLSGRRARRGAAWPGVGTGERAAAAGRAGAERNGPSGSATPTAAAPGPEVSDRKNRPPVSVTLLPPPPTSAPAAARLCAFAAAAARPARFAHVRSVNSRFQWRVSMGRMRSAGARPGKGHVGGGGGAHPLRADCACVSYRRDISHRLLRVSASARSRRLRERRRGVAHAQEPPALAQRGFARARSVFPRGGGSEARSAAGLRGAWAGVWLESERGSAATRSCPPRAR